MALAWNGIINTYIKYCVKISKSQCSRICVMIREYRFKFLIRPPIKRKVLRHRFRLCLKPVSEDSISLVVGATFYYCMP